MSRPAPDPHSHPELDADARALLARAYGLQSQADSQALYRDWATTYDQTMLDGLQYQSPTLVAQMLAQAMPESAARAQAAVLDVGCGTGLAGEALAVLGFAVVDGLDISPEMMAVAMARGAYRQCLQADLLTTLTLPDATYDAAVCCGTFTTGHVGAGCLDEIFRVLRPGAPFAFTVKTSEWERLGFQAALQRMQTTGVARADSIAPGRLYANSPEPDGMFCLVRRSVGA
jgi:predicted TPR repeat methyltransferase